MFENGTERGSGPLRFIKSNRQAIWKDPQIIYSPKENAYFFSVHSQLLYRKNIDSRAPKPITEICSGDNYCLRYSQRANRLLISGNNSILVFNPATNKTETTINTSSLFENSDRIEDLLIFDPNDQPFKFLAINDDLELALAQVSTRGQGGVVRCDLSESVDETSSSEAKMAFCNKMKFLLIQLSYTDFDNEIDLEDYIDDRSPIYIILELGPQSIVFKHYLDFCTDVYSDFSFPPQFYGYVSKDHLLFVKIYYEREINYFDSQAQISKNHFIGIVDYNMRTERVRVMKTHLELGKMNYGILHRLEIGGQEEEQITLMLTIEPNGDFLFRKISDSSFNSYEIII